LRPALVAELVPVGALEEDIVADLARLIWRKQNLATCRTAELAKARRDQIQRETQQIQSSLSRKADENARQELGDVHELVDIGESATLDGLMQELNVADRLDAAIDRRLKRLLVVRGVKSLSSAAASDSPPQIAGPREAD